MENSEKKTGEFDINALKNIKNEYNQKNTGRLGTPSNSENMRTRVEETFHLSNIVSAKDFKKELLKLEETIIDFLKNKYNPKTIRNDNKKEMWIYSDGIYIPNGISIINEELRYLYDINYSKNLSDKIIDKLQPDTFINMDDMFNNYDPYLVPLKDNILNLRNLETIEYDPKYIFFNKLEYNYKKDADCPEIKKHLKEVLDDESDILTLQEAVGNCLLREYKYQKAVMMLGSGSNGKSKTLEIIRFLFTRNNCSQESLKKLLEDPYSVYNLQGKMINISEEVGEQILKDTELFKSLVSDGMISAQRKFLPAVSFSNYAKLFFACNQLPKSWDTSTGFKRRWLKFNFNNKFVPKEQYDPENPSNRIMDVNIMDKVTTKEEMEGFLNFIIKGFKRLEENKKFTNDDISDFWEINSDSVINFCNMKIETVDGSKSERECIKTSEFKYKYNKFCNDYDLKKFPDKQIANILTRDYGAEKSQVMINGERFYVWKNIAWKENYNSKGGLLE